MTDQELYNLRDQFDKIREFLWIMESDAEEVRASEIAFGRSEIKICCWSPVEIEDYRPMRFSEFIEMQESGAFPLRRTP